jgi:hypothetical protein
VDKGREIAEDRRRRRRGFFNPARGEEESRYVQNYVSRDYGIFDYLEMLGSQIPWIAGSAPDAARASALGKSSQIQPNQGKSRQIKANQGESR